LARDEKIDAAFDQPVTIVSNEDGVVHAIKTTPTLPATRMEFIVPTTHGDIRMVDYASVDGWDGTKVCTWLPMK